MGRFANGIRSLGRIAVVAGLVMSPVGGALAEAVPNHLVTMTVDLLRGVKIELRTAA